MKSLEKEKEDYFLLNIFFLNVKYHDMRLSLPLPLFVLAKSKVKRHAV